MRPEVYERIHPSLLSFQGESRVRVFLHLDKSGRREESVWNLAGKLLYKVLESMGLEVAVLEELGIKPLRAFPDMGLVSAEGKAESFINLMDRVASEIVRWVEPVPRMRALLVDSAPMIRAPEAWDAGYTGKGVKVAVVDTGVCAEHPELRGAVVESKSFVPGEEEGDFDGHGTHVAGIVASRGEVYRGIAPGSLIVNAKVLSSNVGNFDDIFAGLRWAVEGVGAEIVNMSFGGSPHYSEIFLKFASWALEQMKRGVVFVAAAGNSGTEGFDTIEMPAISPGVVAVGAVSKSGKVTPYSSRGSENIEKMIGELKPSLVAPGGYRVNDLREGIISTVPPGIDSSLTPYKVDELHASLQGTSMAAPHVSGVLALLYEALREMGVEGGERYSLAVGALIASARSIESHRYEQGHGLIDAMGALRNLGRGRASIPGKESLEGLSRYLWFKSSEKVNLMAEKILSSATTIAGLGLLFFLLSGTEPRGLSEGLTRTVEALNQAYKGGYISREYYLSALYEILKRLQSE